MPAIGTEAKARCEASGCNKTYSSPSNLKRHIKANHNRAVQMSCGKSFSNHQSNIKRHKDTCGCVVLVQPPVPAVGHGVGTDNTADTTTTPTFDVTHMMLNGFNMEYYPADLIFYGPY